MLRDSSEIYPITEITKMRKNVTYYKAFCNSCETVRLFKHQYSKTTDSSHCLKCQRPAWQIKSLKINIKPPNKTDVINAWWLTNKNKPAILIAKEGNTWNILKETAI